MDRWGSWLNLFILSRRIGKGVIGYREKKWRVMTFLCISDVPTDFCSADPCSSHSPVTLSDILLCLFNDTKRAPIIILSSFKCPTSQIRKDAEAKREAKVGLAPILMGIPNKT